MQKFSTLTLVLGLMSAGAAHGALMVDTTKSGTNATALDPGIPPVVTAGDLAEAAGATITGTISGGGGLSFLADGGVGVTDTAAAANLDSEDSFTITLDTTVNSDGYDISELFSVAGWSTSSGGRANQGYGVTFNLVGGGTTVIAAQTFEANNSPTNYWTTVSLTDDSGLLATGVESIVFNGFDNANESANPSIVVYREFDVIGTATVPEPGSLALLGLGGLMMIKRRRRG